jgi:ketosteroid isomerase-like protein
MRRLAAAALLAAPLAQGAYAALTRLLLRRAASRLMEGDVDGFLRFYADDATLSFPGENSWGPEYRGKAEIRAFLERFLSVGLRGEIHEVAVVGPPWDATVFVRFTDHARALDGSLVYENDAVIVLESRWGKVVSERVFEDTEKVAAFDRYLEAREPAVTVG